MTMQKDEAIDIASLHVRQATKCDAGAIAELARISIRNTAQSAYDSSQMSGLAEFAVVDNALIDDGTYFVVEIDGSIRASGGWSRWRDLFSRVDGGSERGTPMDPAKEAARIRSLYTHPDYAGRGLGRILQATAETAARFAGFRYGEMIATPAGEPLYASAGWRAVERINLSSRNGAVLPTVRMIKSFGAGTAANKVRSA